MSIFFEGADQMAPRQLYQAATIVKGMAGQGIEFGRVVFLNGDSFYLASPVDGLFTGVAILRSVTAGQQLQVMTIGVLESPDWSTCTDNMLLQSGKSYYLRQDGKLSIIPDSDGYVVRVGRASSQTVLTVTFDLKVA